MYMSHRRETRMMIARALGGGLFRELEPPEHIAGPVAVPDLLESDGDRDAWLWEYLLRFGPRCHVASASAPRCAYCHAQIDHTHTEDSTLAIGEADLAVYHSECKEAMERREAMAAASEAKRESKKAARARKAVQRKERAAAAAAVAAAAVAPLAVAGASASAVLHSKKGRKPKRGRREEEAVSSN
eukprot:m51a1_g13297 hypothetical protein (186) ;mRNA; r:1769-2477